jgi:hypothetical protein
LPATCNRLAGSGLIPLRWLITPPPGSAPWELFKGARATAGK